MEVIPCSDSIVLLPETKFEKEYMKNLFTTGTNVRRISFDSKLGMLKVKATPKNKNEKI